MHHFAYRDGVLHAEAVNLASLAQAIGTPFYCYSTATLERHYRVFADAFADVPSLVCYAVKANSNQAVIATLARLGAGADVVSGGELKRALAAGVPPRQDHVLRHRQDRGRACGSRSTATFFASMSSPSPSSNCFPPSPPARAAPPNISVRVNPGRRCQDPRQDRHRPGREQVRHSDQPRPRGLRAGGQAAGPARRRRRHAHRQPDHRARRPSTMRSRCCRISCACCARDGHTIAHVDLGGGLGIPYREDNEPPPDPSAYADVVKRATRGLDCRLIFEPGRLIVGNAGILVTRVLYLKRGEAKTFVIVDAAMNDLVRPTLYDAHHDIRPVGEPAPGALRTVADVVGPVCEFGRFPGARPGSGRTQGRRSAGGHVGRRLWRGPGRHLQHPPAGAGSPCSG